MRSSTFPPDLEPASRQQWADLIRNTAIMLVILEHISAPVMLQSRAFSSVDWMAGNIYNVISRSSVPLLFMISGALLLPTQESLFAFFQKRFRRVLIPFLIWSSFYLLANGSFEGLSIFHSIKLFIQGLLTGPAEYHLWFVFELMAIYLVTPILRVFVAAATDKQLWYFAGIWFFFGATQNQIETLLGFEFGLQLSYSTGFIGYFVLGLALSRLRVSSTRLRIAGLVYFAATGFTIWSTQFLSLRTGRINPYYQDLLGWNVILFSVSAFILLKAWGETVFSRPRPILEKFLRNIAMASYGIYLVHVFVIRFLKHPTMPFLSLPRKLLDRYALSADRGPAIIMVPVVTMIVFGISWGIIALLQKNRITRWIT